MEIGERGERSRNWAEKVVFREVEVDELGEFGNEWGKSSGVTRRVEGELGDSGITAGEATSEVIDVRDGAWVGTESPGG